VQDTQHDRQSRFRVVQPDARSRSITFLRLFVRICDAKPLPWFHNRIRRTFLVPAANRWFASRESSGPGPVAGSPHATRWNKLLDLREHGRRW